MREWLNYVMADLAFFGVLFWLRQFDLIKFARQLDRQRRREAEAWRRL